MSTLNEYILDFFNELNILKIRYCHFKSNNNLVPALNGVDDLDLLVSQEDIDAFNQALSKFGFRMAFDRGEKSTPYVFHFFGMDPKTGLLVHLHVYYKLISGGSLVKNHWFQIEDLLLSTAIDSGVGSVKISSHETDFIFFVIRKYIEQPSLIENYLFLKDYQNIIKEFNWFMNRIDNRKVEELIKERLPRIKIEFFNECRSMLTQRGKIVQRVRLGWKMRKIFQVTVQPEIIASLTRFINFGSAFLKARLRLSRKNRFCFPGGKLIAFVGSEATGKSTSTTKIFDWLDKRFDTCLIHVGKPKKNWRTIPFWWIILLSVRLKSSLQKLSKVNAKIKTDSDRILDNRPHPFICLLDSFDRKYWLKKHVTRKFQGAIIIADRYPGKGHDVIDGPRIIGKTRLTRAISRLEKRNYEALPTPDMVFKLNAPLDVTLQRNQLRESPEPEEFVKKRYEMSSQIDFDHTKIVDLDSTLPLDQTIKIIQNFIWFSKNHEI